VIRQVLAALVFMALFAGAVLGFDRALDALR
jgi:hypothetical protein